MLGKSPQNSMPSGEAARQPTLFFQNVIIGGVLSKKFELISPKICRAGGIPPRPPFRPPAEATLSDWTISSFSFRFKRNSGLRPVWWQILLCF